MTRFLPILLILLTLSLDSASLAKGGSAGSFGANGSSSITDTNVVELVKSLSAVPGPGIDVVALVRDMSSNNSNTSVPMTHPLADNLTYLDEEEPGSNAEFLFMFAMGKKSSKACITCDFILYFMSSMTEFSKVVFKFFEVAFPMFSPVMMLIWVGYRVAKTGSQGGGDGIRLLRDLVSKSALFLLVYLFMTLIPDQWVWKQVGPNFLNTAFTASKELTLSAFNISDLVDNDSGDELPYECEESKSSVTMPVMGESHDFYPLGLQLTCVTERTHIIGIATGVAVLMTTFTGNQAGDHGFIYTLLNGAVKVFAGLMITTVFVISAVWMIFLVLDIIVETLVVAAFSPLVALAILWKPSRNFAINAFKTLAGAIVTAISLSMVSVLAYYLLGNIIDIYNSMSEAVPPSFQGFSMSEISGGTKIEQLREFIKRTQETTLGQPQIPMNLSTPWFVYICLAGISIYALGKKMIALITQIIGVGGKSALANSALGLAKSGAATGAKVTAATVGVLAAGAGAAVGLTAFGVGAAAGAVAGKGAGMAAKGTVNTLGKATKGTANTFGKAASAIGDVAGSKKEEG